MSTIQAGQSDIILDADILLKGDYVRTSDDLRINTDNGTTLIQDYFTHTPALTSPNGATITPKVASLLAINTNQGTLVAFEDPQAIGKLTIAEGSATIQRANQTVQVNDGDFIYLNDVIEATGGSVGINFKDQTTMSVDPGAKMVIDDFVYDPENPTTGSMNANVITGNFSFVSGQIAKVGNDAMKVTTPVLTIGVRGTQVAGKANTEGEDNEIVLLPNDDGSVGQIMIKNETGEVLLTKAYEATVIANAYTVPTVPVILAKDVVLKKFASTIATTKKAEKVAELERETEEATKEKEELEEEKEELEEEKEELEEEAEELEEEKEKIEEQKEELEEEKEQIEEKAEELEEKIEELEEKLDEVPVEEKEKILEELEEAKEEAQEVEEVKEQIEEKFEEVIEEEKIVEQKVEKIEEKFEEVKQEVQQIEQKVEFVEEKFDNIVEEFEVFQEEFVQEFEEFIPEEELKQFIMEAPEELVKEFQENIIEKLEEEKINIQENENEVAKDEDPFAEENVEKKLEEIEEKQEELIEEVDQLMEKDMELQKEAQELEEKSKELEEKSKELEEQIQQAEKDGNMDKIEEIEQQFEELDQEFKQMDEQYQELDEQYQELDEQFEEINDQFIVMDEEFKEVFQTNENMPIRIPDDGPGFNDDNDVFDVPIDQQVDDIEVENFIREEKEKALENNTFAQEAEDFFENDNVVMNEDVTDQQRDLFILNTTQMDQYIEGSGNNINDADDYYEQEEQWDDYYEILDNNEQAYEDQIIVDDWFDAWIEDLAEEQNINVAPWLDMPNDTSVSESLSVGTTLGHVYGSDANGDQLTYSILSDESGKIGIDGSKLYLKSAFDNISSDTDYSVLLKVQDPYGASDVDEWVVTVTANAGPSLSSTSTVSMAENASDGATVADIDHTGGDGTVTYSITAGNSEGKFSINSSTGVITYNTQAAVLTTETFESTTEGNTPTGWTGATVDDTTYYGKILGRFNGDSNTGQDVYKTFDFNSSHAGKRVQIDFNFWEFGTWDATNHGSLDQRFMVYVNDTLVVQDLRRYTGNNQQKYGETVGNLGTGWTPAPVESGMATLNSYQEGELYRLYGTLDSNGDIKLGFGARLDESLSNESGAVDNIKISLTDLNYEDATSHTLTITATDASNNTDTVSQLITVTDVNEAPYFIDNVYAARTIDENGSSGTDVAKVHAEDLEGDSITYSITAGNTNSKFTIGSSTGLIETAGALDYETTSSYTLTITATDEHSATDTTTITVNVGDVNEATQYSQGISNTSIDAWGADYSHDMVLNNAWTNPKLLILGTGHGSGASNTSSIATHSDVGYASVTTTTNDWNSYTLKTLSEYSMIMDFHPNNTSLANEQLILDVLQAGKTVMMVGDHASWDSRQNKLIEDIADLIDSDINTNNHTSIASGSGQNSGNEARDIQSAYNVSTYGGDDSGTYRTNRSDGHAATGTFHKEHMGSGDLIAVETEDTNDGYIAEWSREDSDASYHGAFIGHLDGNSFQTTWDGDGRVIADLLKWGLEQNEDAMTESDGAGIVVDSEYLPTFGDSYGRGYSDENDITAVEAIHLGDNVYIGGGMDHIDLVWDDSANAAYWAFNTDMDNGQTPTQADDHYGVIGFDSDGDGDLWETTDTFNLDKIKILDDSEDYLTQDSDATGDYYFKVTPVTYSGGSWAVETSNTVTVSNTTGYNAYLDLSLNTDFQDINYALIETESALISEVVVTG